MPRYRHPFALPAVLLTLTLAVLTMSGCSNRTDSSDTPGDAVFRTLDGQQLTLPGMAYPVLVNFWSTSCRICIEEMPDLARLHDDYADEGFKLIAVAMPHDPPSAVLEFAQARDLPFPVAIDADGAVLENFDSVIGTPTSFLFDADGELVSRHVGKMDWQRLRSELDQLMRRS